MSLCVLVVGFFVVVGVCVCVYVWASAVVVITEADKLSRDAQHALRRIMEKYMANCRYILICNSTNKV
jgi:thiamine phosphate synthase YjbQ (UPF0047 family)